MRVSFLSLCLLCLLLCSHAYASPSEAVKAIPQKRERIAAWEGRMVPVNEEICGTSASYIFPLRWRVRYEVVRRGRTIEMKLFNTSASSSKSLPMHGRIHPRLKGAFAVASPLLGGPICSEYGKRCLSDVLIVGTHRKKPVKKRRSSTRTPARGGFELVLRVQGTKVEGGEHCDYTWIGNVVPGRKRPSGLFSRDDVSHSGTSSEQRMWENMPR